MSEMRMGERRLVIYKDGTVGTPGADYGPGPLKLHHVIGKKFVVVKVKGHSAFAGLGQRQRVGTFLQAFKIIEKVPVRGSGYGDSVVAEFLCEDSWDIPVKGEFPEILAQYLAALEVPKVTPVQLKED